MQPLHNPYQLNNLFQYLQFVPLPKLCTGCAEYLTYRPCSITLLTNNFAEVSRGYTELKQRSPLPFNFGNNNFGWTVNERLSYEFDKLFHHNHLRFLPNHLLTRRQGFTVP